MTKKTGGHSLPDLKTYSLVVARDRPIAQCNTIESPEIEPYKYNQLILDKEAKRFNGAMIAFQQMILKQFDVQIGGKTNKKTMKHDPTIKKKN